MSLLAFLDQFVMTFMQPSYTHLMTPMLCRLQSQAHQEFLTGTQEHLHVEGIDDQELVQEALRSLESELKAWIEQLRQAKVQCQKMHSTMHLLRKLVSL